MPLLLRRLSVLAATVQDTMCAACTHWRTSATLSSVPGGPWILERKRVLKHILRSASLLIGALAAAAALTVPVWAATPPAVQAQQALSGARSYKMTLQTA